MEPTPRAGGRVRECQPPKPSEALALHPGVGGQRPGCSPWWGMRVLPHFLFPNQIPFLPPAPSGPCHPCTRATPSPGRTQGCSSCQPGSQWPRLPPQRTRPRPLFAPPLGLPVLPGLDWNGALVSAAGTDASAPGSRGSAETASAVRSRRGGRGAGAPELRARLPPPHSTQEEGTLGRSPFTASGPPPPHPPVPCAQPEAPVRLHAQHTGQGVGLGAPQAQPTAGEGPGLGRPRPEEPWGAARKLDQGRCTHGSTRTASGCTRTHTGLEVSAAGSGSTFGRELRGP
uniref:Uncharacterized protein n=1 Tax=Pipistrellus kuhlii TaxID=59472 RepID=A0A7J7ZIQ5_PIPKU|nr:hypothetical protein mPipKuh1_009376 [Pipistrellus kuhlii]